jgi:hypothetical protein
MPSTGPKLKLKRLRLRLHAALFQWQPRENFFVEWTIELLFLLRPQLVESEIANTARQTTPLSMRGVKPMPKGPAIRMRQDISIFNKAPQTTTLGQGKLSLCSMLQVCLPENPSCNCHTANSNGHFHTSPNPPPHVQLD